VRAKISFVVIGKNESKKLYKSLGSIQSMICDKGVENICEITYVDSNSTDDSIIIAETFKLVKIIKIGNQPCNAAIARNIGAQNTTGDYIIFLDGDMEFIPEFMTKIFNDNLVPFYDFVSGVVLDYFYDKNWIFINKCYRTYSGGPLLQDQYENTVGGFFCIRRTQWDELNGMDIRFKNCEDLDFGLRMAQIGVPLLRKKELGIIHHTISYVNTFKILKDFISCNAKYIGMLYAKHIHNKKLYKKLIKSEISSIILIISLFISVIFLSFIPLCVYLAIIILKFGYHSLFKEFSLLTPFYLIHRDIIVILSFLFYMNKNRRILKLLFVGLNY
jgi:glycosyltransferase involved in cell wall biosynthesis